MYLFTLHECTCNNSNNLLTGCLIKKLQAFIKKTDGAEYSFISTVFFSALYLGPLVVSLGNC